MRLGLFDMPLHSPGKVHAQMYDDNLELVKYTDKLGYDEAWIGEHFTAVWEPMPTPELFIARALGETERIVLSTGVICLPFHDPVMVAHRIAMLDHLAKGRFYFGIGVGGVPTDFDMFGLNQKSAVPRQMMRESMEVIIKLWTEDDPFEYKGQFFEARSPVPPSPIGLRYHMKPYQNPHPPIAVAGGSPNSETLEYAGEMGWWPMTGTGLHFNDMPKNWAAVERGAAKTGKKPSKADWRIARQIHVGENSQKAKEEALNGPLGRSFLEWFRPLMGLSGNYDALKAGAEIPDEALTPEYMLENFWIVGDPDECTEKIRELYHHVGGFGTLLLVCHDWGRDQKKWYRALELMAKEVLPALQDLPPPSDGAR